MNNIKSKIHTGDYIVLHPNGLCINLNHDVPCYCLECKWFWNSESIPEYEQEKPQRQIDIKTFFKIKK